MDGGRVARTADAVGVRVFFQDFEQEEEREGGGGSESEMDENVGWSMVNLDEEQQQPDVSLPGH